MQFSYSSSERYHTYYSRNRKYSKGGDLHHSGVAYFRLLCTEFWASMPAISSWGLVKRPGIKHLERFLFETVSQQQERSCGVEAILSNVTKAPVMKLFSTSCVKVLSFFLSLRLLYVKLKPWAVCRQALMTTKRRLL